MSVSKKEIWKDIIGYENYYQISNYGNVKSLERSFHLGGIRKEKILKFSINTSGYFQVTLQKNGEKKNYLVHKLVALHFIPNPDNKSEINHKDGNKLNNLINNLEWCTRSENALHAFQLGLRNNKEEKSPNRKLNIQQVFEIRELLNKKIPHKIIAEKYKVSHHCIANINTKRTWKF
jgi:hypothetical protein